MPVKSVKYVHTHRAYSTAFEMEGGAGQTMTDEEQAAETDGSKLLTQDDPVPQTIYRAAVKPGTPVLVTVPLKFKLSTVPAKIEK